MSERTATETIDMNLDQVTAAAAHRMGLSYQEEYSVPQTNVAVHILVTAGDMELVTRKVRLDEYMDDIAGVFHPAGERTFQSYHLTAQGRRTWGYGPK